MPAKVILWIALGIAAVTAVLVTVLWWAGTAGLSGQALVTARFDALRTGLSLGIGGGGVFALYLAWRRQHATEISLVQKERDLADVARAYELQREVADHGRADAEARRITDLYAKSVEQLGSDKAPVRLGGLYALERLAQDNADRPALRQTVVNVLCAYLRMPFTLPGDRPADDAEEQIHDRYDERVQEREVRLTAQRILTAHLDPGPTPEDAVDTFWPNIDLDLSGATLIEFNLNHCRIRQAKFLGARMVGLTRCVWATFTGHVEFGQAVFDMFALFGGTTFGQGASFRKAVFSWRAGFERVTFAVSASFDGATFDREALFSEATFAGSTSFVRTQFAGSVSFNGAVTAHSVSGRPTWPVGWRPAEESRPAEGREGNWYHLVRDATGDATTGTSGG